MSSKAQRRAVLKRLADAWDRHPDLTPGELIVKAVDDPYEGPEYLRMRLDSHDDVEWVNAVTRFVDHKET